MCYTSLHVSIAHYYDLRINSAFEKQTGWWWSRDGKAGSELCNIRNDGAMRHNKILDLVSGVHAIARPAISHYADSIMSVLLPVTPEEKRVTDDARPVLRNNALTAVR